MTDDVAWELRLKLGDGGLEAFDALVESAGVPAIADRAVPGRYGWRPGTGERTAQIVLGYDGPPAAAICWVGDWATAERRLTAIAPGFAGRLLAVAQPVDLVSFGACEGDLPPNTAPRSPEWADRRRDEAIGAKAQRSQPLPKTLAVPKPAGL